MTTGEGTCCWRRSGRSWNCIGDPSCWRSRRLGPGPDLGPSRGRGCSSCGCRHGGCESGDGCGASGGRALLSGSPRCLAGSPGRPGGPSGGGSGGNGTLRKSLCPAGDGKMTSWNRWPRPRSAPQSLCLAPAPSPTQAAAQTGWHGAVGAWRSGGQRVARGHPRWGRGGSRGARWDGTRWLGGTGDDLDGTLKDPVHHRSSGTLYILPQWMRQQRMTMRKAACPVEGSRSPYYHHCSLNVCCRCSQSLVRKESRTWSCKEFLHRPVTKPRSPV